MSRIIFIEKSIDKSIAFDKETLDFYEVDPVVKDIYQSILEDGAETAMKKYHVSDEDMDSIKSLLFRVADVEQVKQEDEKKDNIVLDKLVLNITNVCNLKCAYCYACGGSYHSEEGIMRIETAYKTIDTFCDFFDTIKVVQFFGGEPLINLEVINGVCEYFIRKKELGLITEIPTFGVCTNGTLLTTEAIDLIEKYDINVTVSMDGDKYIHDLNRYDNNGNGTYERIMYHVNELYNRTKQPTTIEVTYNQKHVDNDIAIKDIIRHFKELLPETSFHIVPVSTEDEGTKLKNREAFIESVDDVFASFDSDKAYTYSLVQRLIDALRLKKRSEYICPAGLGTLSVDVHGTIYPCFMFTDVEQYQMGNIADENVFHGEKMKKVRELFRRCIKKQDEKCEDCILQNFCCGCHGMNYYKNNTLANYEEDYCTMNIEMAKKVILNLTDYVNKLA